MTTAAALAIAAALGLVGAASAQPARPDLALLELRAPASGLRIGRCNLLEVTVRNAGAAAAAPSLLRLTVARPGQVAVDQRTLPIGALAAGQLQVLSIPDVLVPEPGPWRIIALADAAGALAESSRSNNERVIDIASVPGLCGP